MPRHVQSCLPQHRALAYLLALHNALSPFRIDLIFVDLYLRPCIQLDTYGSGRRDWLRTRRLGSFSPKKAIQARRYTNCLTLGCTTPYESDFDISSAASSQANAEIESVSGFGWCEPDANMDRIETTRHTPYHIGQ